MNDGNQEQNNATLHHKNDALDICAFLSLMVAFLGVFILPYVLYDDVQPTKILVWDLGGLENELAQRVYGQDEAVSIITKHLREAMEPQRKPREIMFVLFGGPGVGKHLVLNIIKNHIKCKEPCQIQYQNTRIINGNIQANRTDVAYYFNGSLPLFMDFNTLQFTLESTNITNTLKTMYKYDEIKFYFITGTVMNDTIAKSVKNSMEYERLINYETNWAEYDLSSEFPQFNVIIVNFKPLKPNHVTRCLQDQQVNNVTLDYSKDFVPLGCKTR